MTMEKKGGGKKKKKKQRPTIPRATEKGVRPNTKKRGLRVEERVGPSSDSASRREEDRFLPVKGEGVN